MMKRQGVDESYEERSRQAWVLIDAGIIGDDRREPQLTREAMEILFEGAARSANLEIARSLGGPVEWSFTDFEPWHMVVTNGHAEAKPGSVDNPALRLEISSADWARIAMNRADPRIALLKRRLKLHGSLSARAKLPKLFL
jgi:hypothetical protein